MRIGMIVPPWIPVPPPGYGGIEEMAAALCRALTRAGHEVVLVGHPDSTAGDEQRTVIPTGAEGPIGTSATELAHVIGAYELLDDVDVIHDHTMVGPFAAAAIGSTTPIVVTSHGPFDSMTIPMFRRMAEHARIIAVSASQASAAPDLPIGGVVHHGLDLADWPLGDGSGCYVLFLGRMHPDKGIDRAVKLTRAAGRRLLIAAKMREPLERQYFADCVEPLLGDDVEFLGEVGAREKRRLLAGAEALLNPIRWAEPFGMVMLEALACGTPVLAPPLGAASEIVVDGVTGALGPDAVLVEAMRDLSRFDRTACRCDVQRRFSIEGTACGYVAQYRVAAIPT
jgi:glycosyltransferase involved in cell wall biosynthesis